MQSTIKEALWHNISIHICRIVHCKAGFGVSWNDEPMNMFLHT